MKFTRKLAAVAGALAMMGAAHAADIDVAVYDPVSGTNYVFDTGVAVTSTAPSFTSVTLSSLSGWSTFAADVAAGGGSVSSLDYLVLGASTTGSGKSVVYNDDISLPSGGKVETPNFNSVYTTISGAVGQVNALNWTTLVGAYPGTFGGYAASGTESTTGTAVNVYYVSATSTAGSATAGTALTSADLTATTFTIGTASAVPEPGTYALMAAGLLAVGAIVRRRSRA